VILSSIVHFVGGFISIRKYLFGFQNEPEETKSKDVNVKEGLKLFAFKILPLRDFNLKN
jgi:hypothetical protein